MSAWWWKLGGACALLGVLFVAEQAYEARLISVADAAGYARAKGEWVASEAAITLAAEAKAGVETRAARAETAALQLKFDQLADRQQKDRIDHEIAKNIAVAAALAGSERLSILVDGGAVSGAVREGGAVEGTGARAIAQPEARAAILPGASAVILRVAGDYGQLVRDYNAVVERYNAARAVCNAD